VNSAYSKAWLRGFNQASTYLGLAMIALMWLGLTFHQSQEHDTVQRNAIRNARNLARAFEGHLVTTLKNVDRILYLVRNSYEQSPKTFDVGRWSKEQLALEGPAFQIVIIGPNGVMKATTAESMPSPIDLSDREHFKVHIDSKADDLFISKPLVGRVTGKISLQLSRKIRQADGTFGGVVVISIDPNDFTRFYDSINIGHDGAIRVVGSDGIVRAGRQRNSGVDFLGTSLAGSTLLARASIQPSGWYFTASAKEDNVKRLIFYRVLQDFPLIVTVGLGAEESFAGLSAELNAYNSLAALVTALILIVMGFSIHDRAQLERAGTELKAQNARFDAALNNMSHGLCMTDADHRIVVCNETYVRMFRLSSEEVRPGTTLQQLMAFTTAKGSHIALTSDELAGERLLDRSKVARLADGRDFQVLSRPMANGGWVTTYEDITERLQSESRIYHMARHDALTGVANRILFLEDLETGLAGPDLLGGGFTVFMLDLDQFKVINDTLGHGAGDVLLQMVASRLRSCLRQGETIARLGGDEFAILQKTKIHQRAEAAALAGIIINCLSTPYDVNGHEIVIGTSIGIAMAPEQGTSTEQLMKKADLSLYQSKVEGRNGYCFFEPSMEAKLQIRSTLENDLRHALERDQFVIHYQAIVSVVTEELCGMEALIRWKRGANETVYPGDFIQIAEDIGMITPIGTWVLATACKDAMDWPSHVKLAVNLSPAQFWKSELVEIVASALAESGLPAHRLELEITETVLLESSESNLRVLEGLKALGVSIVLDDFGTGYSSLSYLRMFAFDKIKIDRSFVIEVVDRPECAAIVCAIINLGRSLGVATVAEGVETELQLMMLRAAGCSEAQGNLFSEPVPMHELTLLDGAHSELVVNCPST
jgi:diguanylate cyclase (GGDEF)-like protein